MERALKVRMRPMLRLAFAIVAIVWLVAEVGASLQTRKIEANVRDIVDNAVASILLVQRMSTDVQRRRMLIDQHIMEKRTAEMARLETEIARTQADYTAAMREYAPIAIYPGEAEARDRLATDVAAVDAPIVEVLALSRNNSDVEAQARMVALEPKFDAIEGDIDALLRINRAAAVRAEGQVHAQQNDATIFHFAMTLAAVLATLALGVVATRIVNDRERRLQEDAVLLEQKNQELDAFAGRVAHDLRGPLGTMSLAASTLAKQAPAAEPTVAVLRRGIARMNGLIEDLLKLSRVGTVARDAVADAGAVAALVEDDLQRRVKEVDGALHVDVEKALVHCDEGFLREVIWNLGENAVKYRRVDVRATIDVTGRVRAQFYELTVADNGAGMSPEDARRAFDPFFRGKSAGRAEGTGLGLSIVKRVVEASGGSVSVRSREGEGTTFVVELPLAGG